MQTVHARPRPQLSALALYGLAGLALSVVVHLATYAGVAVQESVPLIWGLHIGIFPLFIPFVLRLRRLRGEDRRPWGELFPSSPYVPRWARVVVPALFIYTGINFFAATTHLPQRGESARPETHEVRVYTARAFSGHWIFFYALPTLFFLYAPQGSPTRTAGADGADEPYPDEGRHRGAARRAGGR